MAGEGPGAKLARAQKLGTPVLDEEGFERLVVASGDAAARGGGQPDGGGSAFRSECGPQTSASPM